MDFIWTCEPNLDSGSKYDNQTPPLPPSKLAAVLVGSKLTEDTIYQLGAQMILNYQDRHKHYQQEDQSFNQQEGFIISEVMVWFTGQHKTPKFSLNKQSYIKTMLQLIFDREQLYDTSSALTYGAISNCNVQTRRYAHVRDIDILFNHWIAQHSDEMLSNKGIEIKFESFFLSLCILRLTEISEIEFNLSNF
ncbi:MAG: hypothetical protein EZS28_033849 [Streblomastix strix]|uniref:Uncharacterized protein n=1 Tax=Streblomastix strix TaxID=222440 RepID=A0A5J4UK66_9EUKA|nr:MAG: hypothetical protein EZS28_033849 [Streblomastix strix]